MADAKQRRAVSLLAKNPQDPWVSSFQKRFKDLFSEDFEWLCYQDRKTFLEDFAHSVNAQVTVVAGDWGDEELGLLFGGLRKAEPESCLILLLPDPIEKSSALQWIDRGVNAVLDSRFDPTLVDEALREIIDQKIGELRESPRIDLRAEVTLRIASLEQAIVAELLNIGRGGMFLRVIPPGISRGDHIKFELQFSQSVSVAEVDPITKKEELEAVGGVSQTLEGVGKVSWVRTQSAKDLPEGIGLQFVELTPFTKSYLDDFIAKRRIKEFIPKS